MKFCDKLANLRKKNNITQEVLADRLNVSRQAVSKWENGTSMPDMEKIMELCKILNCSLDELVDDRAVGNTTKNDSKFNINTYLKDILDFITKTYNMFCSMKLKERIKCILEMITLTLILYLLWMILGSILANFIDPVMYSLSDKLHYFIRGLFESIYLLISFIGSSIIILHIFKIRYLDYFITIEDANIKEKTIEDAIPENKSRVVKENEKKVILEQQKEKIIIRDPKHSGYSFFSALGKLVMIFLKAMAFVVGVFAIISFISIAFGLFVDIFYAKQGLIFISIAIILLGLLILNFLVIDILYKFICNLKFKKYIFISFIITIMLISLGSAITFQAATDFKKIDNIKDITSKRIETKYIEVDNKTMLPFINNKTYNNIANVEIIINEKLKDVQIDIISAKDNNATLEYHNNSNKDFFYISWKNYNPIDAFKILVNMLKDKELYDYNDIFVQIHTSTKNLNILKNNLK